MLRLAMKAPETSALVLENLVCAVTSLMKSHSHIHAVHKEKPQKASKTFSESTKPPTQSLNRPIKNRSTSRPASIASKRSISGTPHLASSRASSLIRTTASVRAASAGSADSDMEAIDLSDEEGGSKSGAEDNLVVDDAAMNSQTSVRRTAPMLPYDVH
jgi:hypothetical protein